MPLTSSSLQLPSGLNLLRRLQWPRKLGCLERLYSKSLASRGIIWIETAHGLEWKLDLENATHRWLVYGDYQGPHLRRWAEKNLPQNPSLILSGANIGQMIASLHPKLQFSHILGFEPDQEARQWLQECLAKHPEIPLELLPYGLGAEVAEVSWIHASWTTSHGAQSRVDPSGTDRIPIVRLDDMLDERAWEKADLWILDVEGFEAHALAGARHILQRKGLGALCMEVDSSPESYKAVQILADHGYSGYQLDSQGRTRLASKAKLHGDLLFLPNQ
ncbi:MAG: FkbM family methyltransferase [Blastochloris sp.]|nr:FkbM family methyltransferase [Blastochloris sp.]